MAEPNEIIDNIATAGYDAANSILLGLPDFLVNNLGGSKAKKAIDEMRKKHEVASTVGNIGGLVGSMFIPGGAIVKGLGAGAKAIGAANTAAKLGKAAEWMKGGELTGNLLSKVGQAAARGAATSAEQVIPRAFMQGDYRGEDDSFDLKKGLATTGQALADAPGAIAMGAGVSGALGPMAQRLASRGNAKIGKFGETAYEKGAQDLKEKLDINLLGKVGIETKALRTAARNAGYGRATQNQNDAVKNYVSELADGIRNYGIKGEREFEALIAKNQQAWKHIDETFNQTAQKGWNKEFAQGLGGDADFLQKIDELGSEHASGALFDLVNKIQKIESLPSIKNQLGNIIKDGFNSSSSEDRAKAFVASQIKKKLYEFVIHRTNLPKEFIDETKKDFKLVQPFLQQDFRDFTKIPKSSPGSQTHEKAIMGAVAVGGAGTNLTNDEGELDLGKAAKAGVIGGLGGLALSKGMMKGKDLLKGIITEKASGIVANPKVQAALIKVGENIGNPAQIGKTAAIIQQEASKSEHPEQTIQAKEQTMDPGMVNQAKQEFSQQYQQVFNDKLSQMYNQYYSDMPQEEFLRQVAAGTNNFTNMPAMAEVLFDKPDQRKDFLQKYDAYLSIKDLDISKAMAKQGPLAFVPGFEEDKKQARSKLVDGVAQMVSGGDINKKEKLKKEIAKNLKLVEDNPDELPNFVQTYGLDFQDLRQLGLA